MKGSLITLLLAGIAALPLIQAGSFEDGNREFAAGDFPAAVESYQKALEADGPDAAVYYNLGNAWQSEKKYGPAILAYERARLLTPRDPDLAANLALARKAATAFEEPELHPKVDATICYLSRNEWSLLVAGSALLLGALALLRGLMKWPVRWTRQLGAAVAVLAGLVIAAGSTVLWLRRSEAARGIVLVENAAVRLSPFGSAESLGTAVPGRVVHLGKKSGDFQYIEVSGTELKGWLANADVAAISTEAE